MCSGCGACVCVRLCVCSVSTDRHESDINRHHVLVLSRHSTVHHCFDVEAALCVKHAFETKNHIHYSPASLSIIRESHVFVVFLKDRLRGPDRTKDGPEFFLHIAAQVGHKPVCVLLQQFKPEYQAQGMPLSTSVWCSLPSTVWFAILVGILPVRQLRVRGTLKNRCLCTSQP